MRFPNLWKKKETAGDPFHTNYDEIRFWIESRIGPLSVEEGSLPGRLWSLYDDERIRLARPLGVVPVYSGNMTLVSGDPGRDRRRLKSIGFRWNGKTRAWVCDGHLSLEELNARLAAQQERSYAGLKKYIEMVEYRVRLQGQVRAGEKK